MTGSARHRPTFALRELLESGSHSDLVEQFALSRSADAPEGWESDVVGSWRLARNPTLPAVSLVDETGVRLGWWLGYPITPHGRLLVDASSLTVGVDVDQDRFVDDPG